MALLLSLLASLTLHVSAIGVVHAMRQGRHASLTESRPPAEVPQVEPHPQEEEPEEFTPGIERGAKAVVTWIGYEQYEEHLAQLSETDQAAFTSAVTRGVPDSTSRTPSPAEVAATAQADPLTDKPSDRSAPTEVAAGESAVDPGETSPPESAPTRTQPRDVTASPPQRDHPPQPPLAPALEGEERAPLEQPSREHAKPEDAQPEAPARIEGQDDESPARQVVESAERDPLTIPVPLSVPLQPMRAPAPSAAQGEPTPHDAAPSEKDAAPTSTRPVPEIEWDSGKPLAREGMEIRPFPLYRHIMWDSRDVMFAQQLNRGRWEGRVLRNPIVSLRFDRYGRAGDVRIIRPSGYKPLDELYLKSWMARWTASDTRLAELAPDELTTPVQFKIIFISEAPPPGAGSNGR